MPGMAIEPGVVDPFDGGVVGQKLRYALSAGYLLTHAQRQGADAPHYQPTIKRRRHGATEGLHHLSARSDLVVTGKNQGPAEHVGVPTDVFGGGMHYDVGAMCQGALYQR